MAIGTAAALLGGSIISGIAGSSAASKAASAQKKSSKSQIALQTRIYDETKANYKPFLEGGVKGNAALLYELGLGPKPQDYAGYMQSPMAKYLLTEGQSSIEGSRAAAGGLYSGATLAALEENRRNVIGADTAQYFDRLAGMSNVGLSAAGNTANAGQYFASSATGAMQNAANARAQAALQQGQIIGSTIGDMAGIYGYFQNPLAAYASPTAGMRA